MLIILMLVATVNCKLMDFDRENLAENPLLDTLRRRLMENNYDYQSGDTDDDSTPLKQAQHVSLETHSKDKNLYGRFQVVSRKGEPGNNWDDRRYARDEQHRTTPPRVGPSNRHDARIIKEAPSRERNVFKVHQKAVGLNVDTLRQLDAPQFRANEYTTKPHTPLDHVVAKKDLLYYVDDNQLRRNYDDFAPRVNNEPKSHIDPSHTMWNAPQSKLKMLRRNNGPQSILDPPQNMLDMDRKLLDDPQSIVDSLRRQYEMRQDPVLHSNLNVDYEEMYPQDDVTPPKVKYKLLKVREKDGWRRYLQERGENGVALISVDAAPFPHFQLPHHRRQYMPDEPDDLMPVNSGDDHNQLASNSSSQQLNI